MPARGDWWFFLIFGGSPISFVLGVGIGEKIRSPAVLRLGLPHVHTGGLIFGNHADSGDQ